MPEPLTKKRPLVSCHILCSKDNKNKNKTDEGETHLKIKHQRKVEKKSPVAEDMKKFVTISYLLSFSF